MTPNADELMQLLEPYFASLKDWQFYASNPVLWGIMLLVLFISARWWGIKKSFGFCAIISVMLLATTKVETMITESVARSGETFDPFITRMLAFVLMAFVLAYYAFMKESF